MRPPTSDEPSAASTPHSPSCRSPPSSVLPAPALPPRMELLVYRPQVLAIDVRVDLRRGDVGVTEHFLYGTKVRPSLQQVRGERMPQRVRRHVLLDPGPLHVLLEDLPCAHAGERLAASVHEQCTLPPAPLD